MRAFPNNVDDAFWFGFLCFHRHRFFMCVWTLRCYCSFQESLLSWKCGIGVFKMKNPPQSKIIQYCQVCIKESLHLIICYLAESNRDFKNIFFLFKCKLFSGSSHHQKICTKTWGFEVTNPQLNINHLRDAG